MGFQTAQEAIEWIHSLKHLGIKPGLKRMEWLMERLGHPERLLKCVHIAGTNGKGSTLAFMRHVLQEAGYQVGTFTSPYLIRFQNRIQVNGEDIADGHLVQVVNKIKPLVEELAQTELGSPTEFEVVTTLAIEYFARIASPDVVLWETGLGGRLDSTNIVIPIATVITNVGYDHMHLLGDTLESIAAEKAGIIKPGVPLITAVEENGPYQVIERTAKEKKASIYRLGQAFFIEDQAHDEEGQSFSYRSLFTRLEQLHIRMKGVHQLHNAAVALMTLEVLKQFYALIWEEEELRRGLEQTTWSGRLEVIQNEPLVLLDGAHNPQGMEALAQSLARHYPRHQWTIIFSAMKDKPVAEMIKPLAGVAKRLVLTQFEGGPRTAAASDLLQAAEQSLRQVDFDISMEPDWEQAYRQAVASAGTQEGICFAGSLYFISEVRQKLRG
ncbi:bifunctional folylpolyglutamate synthase/dihydrofolate synthase [Caldalkalibacillus thermarum]|uniref:bifunctional folylpolyglutamate synthase/dihydrofolate synthase n=1 Tax=Caldalkalibacillus thermarum TaxID=296745 RepID=UPI0016636982|nr:folylpolyglutamate synthase/dihydrofolate synthase family protein [Caldalkalibacillus thermarum]GGK15919.1 bifunctional folylpolyglutamate synthase/dihydrofolate synthase [Caldalkalibacillus thermarum]